MNSILRGRQPSAIFTMNLVVAIRLRIHVDIIMLIHEINVLNDANHLVFSIGITIFEKKF